MRGGGGGGGSAAASAAASPTPVRFASAAPAGYSAGAGEPLLAGASAERCGAWATAVGALVSLLVASARHAPALLDGFARAGGYALLTEAACGSSPRFAEQVASHADRLHLLTLK